MKCAQEGIETTRNASPARAIKLDLSITTPVKRKLASANRMLKVFVHSEKMLEDVFQESIVIAAKQEQFI